MNERALVTGLGVVSSIGIGKDVFWDNLIKGISGIAKVSLFNTTDFRRHYAGEIKNFNAQQIIRKGLAKFLGRASQFAIVATRLALDNASLSSKEIRDKRIAVILGVTIPEGNVIDISSEMMLKNKADEIRPEALLNIFAPAISRNVGRFFNIKDMNVLIPCACAAGNYAIGYGYDLIKSGNIELAIVGGVEALSRIAFQGFQRLYAMAPEKCSPFDKDRQGMILGEGAGILILESSGSAAKRRVHAFAEVLGYGLSCDAHHMTIPRMSGIKKAMQKALNNSAISANDIDYISAHGTGTKANDKAEASAIKELFYADENQKTPVSSLKSMLGHCMGAASGIEAVACCLALEKQIIPPTINFSMPDPECDIDCVPNQARSTRLRVVLNNGFAFGGNNCCVVFSLAS